MNSINLKKVKGDFKTLKVHVVSKSNQIDEKTENVQPHIVWECPHCKCIQATMYEEKFSEKEPFKCDDCRKKVIVKYTKGPYSKYDPLLEQ